MNVTGGTFNTSHVNINNYSTLNTEENPSVLIDGEPSLTATEGNVISNAGDGLIHIKNGTMNMPTTAIATPTVINCKSGKIIISGGTIKMAGGNAAVYSGYSGTGNAEGTIEIRGGTIESTTSKGINVFEKTKLVVSGGYINSYDNGINQNGMYTSVIVTGGTIVSTKDGCSGIAILSGPATITGGTITGKKNGVWTNNTNPRNVTLGTNDGKVSVTSPNITGGVYGINAQKGTTFNFYDGKLTGAKGNSISGTVTSTASGYIVQKTTEKSIETATLIQGKYENETSTKGYMTLKSALDEAKTGEKIKVLQSTTETEAPTLAADKTVVLDLNGQTTTLSNVTLTNNGTLTIAGASGTLTGSGADIITNNGVLVKDTATEIASSATADYYVLRNDGTATISAGKLTSSYGGIYNGTNAKLNMIGGTLNSTYTAIRNYSTLSSESNPSVVIDGTSTSLTATGANVLNNQQTGLVYIKNGTLNMPTTTIATPTVINCRSGKVLISGGKIKMAGANAAVYNGYSGNSTADGTVEMTGGSIESTASFGIYSCEKTKLIVSGGSVLSSGGDAIMQIGSESASTTITGGTITSTKPGKSGLSICNGTVNITGGKIIGKAFGIWCHDTIKSTLTLGENDGKVSITTPEISGTEWGIYTGTATINFYDGILKGAIGQSIKGSNTIILTAPGYIVQKTTANSVETATLVPGGNQTVTYDLNETDMNNWLGLYKDRFTISYDSGTKLNQVTCKTDSGWEQLYIPIETVVGKTYTVEFDYQVPKAYDNLTTYTGAECQIVKTVIDNYKTDNVIAKEILPNTVQTTTKTASITFTATTTKVYFTINYGTIMDYRTVTLKFGNFKMKDTIEYNKKITTIPVIGNTNYMFDGWYTQKTGGTKVTEETVISTANPTYYAHWSEIKVGDIISYSPSGTYSWDKSYATSNETGTQTLNSASGQSFNVSKWKVLSIDKAKGKIEMVPETIPSGTVTLQGAQGYNNAVKLLNDACSSLYSDTSKGITARSITEEDFVKVGGTKWKNKRAAYTNVVKYGNQYGTPYTTNKYYPTMYKNEANHVIDETKTESGLKQSEQTSLIAKTDEKATNGYLKAETSIQPYQTHYNTTDYATTASLLEGYSSILLPKGSSTTYWVASRCVYLYLSDCIFDVRFVYSGFFDAGYMFHSGAGGYSISLAVFPVVSLSSQLLEKTADGTYNVK